MRITSLFLSVQYLFVIVVDVFKNLSLSLSPFVIITELYIYMVFGCQSMRVVKRTKKRGVDWAFLVFGVKRWSGHESREKL